MKKISKMQARLNQKPEEREPLGKPNKMWDSLNDTFITVSSEVDRIGLVLFNFVSVITTEEYKPLITNPDVLAILINKFSEDFTKHKEVINSIHAKHANRKGNSKTEDEHMTVISLHQEYMEANEIFMTNTQPTINEISTEIEKVQNLIKEKEQQKQKDSLIDNNVIEEGK